MAGPVEKFKNKLVNTYLKEDQLIYTTFDPPWLFVRHSIQI